MNLNKTASKLHVRGEKGFALVPDAESYGYLFYIPTKHRVVSSSNFVAIKNDVDIDENEEYDNTIFDDLITTFLSNNEKSTLQTRLKNCPLTAQVIQVYLILPHHLHLHHHHPLIPTHFSPTPC